MLAFVGCRTTKERNARGKGIGTFRVDPETGRWTPLHLLEGLVNPSWLTLDRSGTHLYGVHGDGDTVSAFAVDMENGAPRLLNTVACGGRNPVHLIADATNRFLLVANFATGTIGVLPRQADGSLGALVDCYQVPGVPGPHRHQQKGMHPHQIVYDPAQTYLLVPDKGGDKVSLLTFDAARSRLTPHQPASVSSRAGAAPRHMVFHPRQPLAFVVNELDSTLTRYAWDAAAGVLSPRQIVSLLPEDFTTDNTGAGIAISPCGQFLYASNRGHESIAIFAIDEAGGRLTSIGWEETRGLQPRFFTLSPDGRFLYAANEASDTIQCFATGQDGLLTWRPENTVAFGSPTCIVFKP